MHREFHPTDIEHLRLHAFDANEVVDHHAMERRSLYFFTAILGVLLGCDVLFGFLGWTRLQSPIFGISLATIAAVLGGSRIVYGALEALLNGRVGADIALAQACLAALIIGQPFVAAEVVFIAMVGEVLEAITFARAQREVQRLVDQAPRMARVVRSGEELEIAASAVVEGDLVVVKDGERIPVDGPILAGRSTIDQSALTGESLPVDRGPGDSVYSGTINQYGRLEIRAERVGHQTTMGQVLKLVADARRRKAPIERTADKLARYFLPVVEVVAGLTLLSGWILGWSDKWSRAVAVLVVACPCALILATPAAVLASMAWMAKRGILIKGSVALEQLATCNTFAFDKTGTLTRGLPEIVDVVPLAQIDESALLGIAAAAESASRHPLGKLVVKTATDRGITLPEVEAGVALPGSGVSARLRQDQRVVLVGNQRLLTDSGIELSDQANHLLSKMDARGETPLLVAVSGQVVGLIGVRDSVRREAHDTIHELKHLKITELALLTGDRPGAAQLVGKKVHIKEVHSELLPVDKAHWIQERQATGRRVVMVGDGINDAPALAQADVGITLAKVGSDLAAEAGDILLLGEPLVHLPDLVRLARATVRIIQQNILVFAFGLNAIAMTSAALGFLGPVPAAILHQAGSFLVLLNAMRLLWFGEWSETPPGRAVRALRHGMRWFDDRFDMEAALSWLAINRASLSRWGVLALVIGYAISGLTAIRANEVGLLTTGGRFSARLEPGLHFLPPWPISALKRIEPERIRSIEVGFRSGTTVSVSAESEALMMTGDGRLVEIAAVVQVRPARGDLAERSLAFAVADPIDALRPLAEASLRSVVGRQPMESLLSSSRSLVERETRELLQNRASICGLGLEVIDIALQDVQPPRDVLNAFRDVTRAENEKHRRSIESEAYRDLIISKANSQTIVSRLAAEARATDSSKRAEAHADAFLYLIERRRDAPLLTDHRLYWETVTEGLAQRPKWIIEPSHAGRRQLILPEPGIQSPLGPPLLRGPIPSTAPSIPPDR